MSLSRRQFVSRSMAFSAGFAGLGLLMRPQQAFAEMYLNAFEIGYGPLLPDPSGLLDLPKGFSYTIVSQAKSVMDDGLLVPEKHDGMATFADPSGLTIIVRNHELDTTSFNKGAFGKDGELLTDSIRAKLYDSGKGKNPPAMGGTTTVVFDTKTRETKAAYLSLGGTVYNCAGGPTPWGTWLSCEETQVRSGDRYSKDHGFVFEVTPSLTPNLATPRPIEPLGRFQHEAVAIDPATGIVYMTEDVSDGLFYRFIPKVPGKLIEGGRLQCLMIREVTGADLRNWEKQTASIGSALPVEWIDVEDILSPNDDMRYAGNKRGAAVFARGEGMWYADGVIYFACTSGGKAMMGQIWKYTPSAKEGTPEERTKPAKLELFVEPNDGAVIGNCDNITVAPWGDLFVCEDCVPDDDKENLLLGVTPAGKVYKFGRNAKSASEFAGATFSPDGTTMFVNIQGEGQTFAIQGPWAKK